MTDEEFSKLAEEIERFQIKEERRQRRQLLLERILRFFRRT